MNIIWAISGWILVLFFTLLTISMLLTGNWPAALVGLLLVLLSLPPVTTLLRDQFEFSVHPLLRGLMIAGLLFLFFRLMLGGERTSIYESDQVKTQFAQIYDQKMAQWPVPYEDVFLDTSYGLVHVIASGPQDAPPLLLLHASGVGGWSWRHNASALSQDYRIYAIDLIGDAGKSEFANMDHVMKNGRDQADLYKEISDKLGAQQAFLAGASEGGFIASNYALYYPERVKKMALLAPMGYAGATESIIRITLAQLFPLQLIQDSTFRWAFGDSPQLIEEFGQWFRLLMSAAAPVKVAPLPLPAEQRQGIEVPVLFVFGEKDNLVGDPQRARDMVQDMQDVQVEIVDAGHLMGAERPLQVNQLLLDFFEE